MKLFSTLSLKYKLVIMILTVALFSMGTVLSFVIVRDLNKFRTDMVNSTLMKARLIGEYCITPLVFDDKKGALEVLRKIEAIPEIESSSLYDRNGALFTSYSKIDVEDVECPFREDSTDFSENHLHVFQSVFYRDEKYGSIYLCASTDPMHQKIREYLIVVFSLAIGIALLSWMLANRVQRILSDPITHLATITERISKEGDYTIRVEKESDDEIGRLYDGFNQMLRQIEIRDESIRKNEKQLRNAQRVAKVGDWTWNRTSDEIYWSDEIYRIYGLNKEEITPSVQTFLDLLHPEDLMREQQEPLDPSLAFYEKEFRIIHQQTGEIKHIFVRAERSFDDHGKLVRETGTLQDVTAYKRTEEQLKASLDEKVMLLKEVHHRVKNNLQIVASLLRLQSVNVFDERDLNMFRECDTRIQSMAMIHEKLYQAEELAGISFNSYLEDISRNLVSTYSVHQNIGVTIDADDIKLGLDAAIPCGLLVNELLTNALQHAFPADREGMITIGFKKKEQDTLELTVSDNGVGIPGNIDPKKSKSLGMRLISILAEGQLKGTLEIKNSKGSTFIIRFRKDAV